MKYITRIAAALVVAVAALYIVAFTSVGNRLIRPIVEAKIQDRIQMQSKLQTFSLGMRDFEILLELSEGNTLAVKGEYSLFAQTIHAEYDVALRDLASLRSLTQTELRGELLTKGVVQGDLQRMRIRGESSLAKSDTHYDIKLQSFTPVSIIASMKDAKLSEILFITKQRPYAAANVDMQINFRDIRAGKMDGEVVLKTKEGRLDPKTMLQDFNVTIPKTRFTMDLDATLKGNSVDYGYKLFSNLFEITSSGKVSPRPLQADARYALDVTDLAVLKPLTHTDIRGALKVKGSLRGTQKKLIVEGVSDIASSDSVFEAVLKDFSLISLRAKIVDLDVAKMLYMLHKPHYTDGFLSMRADIDDVRDLQGSIVTTLSKGVLDSSYFTQKYKFRSYMPKTTYHIAATTLLHKQNADTKLNLRSSIANLEIKNARLHMRDRLLESDYRITLPNLDALYFLTNRRLKGRFEAQGEVSKKEEDLDVTMHSRVAGGELRAKLHNRDLELALESMQMQKLLEMLLYPPIAIGTFDAKVNYDLQKSKGSLKGRASEVTFAKNQTFNLIKRYTKFDMYRERFDGEVDAKIYKEDIAASIDLRSKEASITTEATKLDTKTKKIDTDVTLKAKQNEITARLVGDVDAPKVIIDLNKFMRSKAGKKVEEKVKKEVGKLLNKLF